MISRVRSTKVKKILIITTIIALVAISVFVIFMPPFVNALIKDRISKTMVATCDYPGTKDFGEDIVVDSHFTGLVVGIVDHIQIDIKNIAVKGVEVDALEINLRRVRFDVASAIIGRKVKVHGIDRSRATIEINESTLNNYVSKNYKNSDTVNVKLPGDRMEVTKTVPLLGSVTIKFQPSIQGNLLVLKPVDVDFSMYEQAPINIPDSVKDRFTKDYVNRIEIDLPVKDLPFNMEVRHIRVLKGKIELIADNKV